MKKRILVQGPALSRSGYGEQTRFALRCLKSREDIFDIYLVPTSWGKTGWIWEENEEREWLDNIVKKAAIYNSTGNAFYDATLQVGIPNEWNKIAPINIGYTAGIETTKIAPQWIEKCFQMDHIITTSEHAKHGFENTTYQATDQNTGQVIDDFRCQTPLTTVNYCVKEESNSDLLDLDLEHDFNFLLCAQWGPRKNVDNTIRWFVEEFHDQEVGLVAKLNWHNDSINDRVGTERRLKQILSNYKDRKCKVYLLHGSMTDDEMSSLYQQEKIKCLLSITHGEGFGLPIFEAAYHGMPIITCDWSGHVDFLNFPVVDKKTKKKKNKSFFSKVDYKIGPIPQEAVWDGVLQADSQWCYADQGSFKMKMREMIKNEKIYKKRALDLQKILEKERSAEKQYDEFCSVFLQYLETEEEKEWKDILDQVVSYE
jgi:glycosyltransferase involved in cell wall biosynthesis